MFTNIAHWLEQRHAIAELSAMPDYLLADLGIDRSSIPAVVKGMQQRSVAPTPVPTAPVANSPAPAPAQSLSHAA